MTGTSESISFDRIAAVYDATRGGVGRGWLISQDLLGWIGDDPIVEIGVGTGAVALPVREQLGRPVVGFDLSPNMLLTAQERLGNVVAVGDVARLPLPGASVGSLVCVWLLQLVADLQAVFDECARVLRPGGRMAISLGPGVMVDDEIDRIREQAMTSFRRPGSSPDAVRAAAGAAGLTVLDHGLGVELRWEQTPNHEADRIEQRTYGSLLDLDEARWAVEVQPAIDALRAMPDPDRPRQRASRHPYVILGKSM